MYTTLIEPTELAALDPGQVCIIDARHDLADPAAGRRAWRQSRIPGAIFLHGDDDLAGSSRSGRGRHPLPDREAFHRTMVAAGVGKNMQVVIYDAQNGVFASRVWWMLRWLGHRPTAVLNGGWQAWQQAGLPIDESSAPQRNGFRGPAAQPLELGVSLTGQVDVNDVLRNLEQPRLTLVDARAAPRYRGEVEPLDPVAGHIPGALNRPQTLNLTDDGRFKSPERLRQEFQTLLGSRAPETVVHSCGSGVSACHNILAMEYAGLAGSWLYPGSWSEWCSDPSRPVARGDAP